jgi:hypothetical protein
MISYELKSRELISLARDRNECSDAHSGRFVCKRKCNLWLTNFWLGNRSSSGSSSCKKNAVTLYKIANPLSGFYSGILLTFSVYFGDRDVLTQGEKCVLLEVQEEPLRSCWLQTLQMQRLECLTLLGSLKGNILTPTCVFLTFGPWNFRTRLTTPLCSSSDGDALETIPWLGRTINSLYCI